MYVTSSTGLAAQRRQPVPSCAPVTAPVLSPNRARAASDLSCSVQGESHSIALVITNPAGQEQSRFSVQPQKQFGEACLATGDLYWLDNTHVRLLCNYSPALNGYVIVNTDTRKIEDEYTGLDFERSPDGRLLARIGVLQRYASPAGQNYCLVFNRATIYPPQCVFEGEGPVTHPLQKKGKRFSNDAYSDIHTFLSPLAWSPDSHRAALVEKIFNWNYSSPYNRDFYGYVNNVRYYLAILSPDGAAVGYSIAAPVDPPQLQWQTPSQLTLNGMMYNLSLHPPTPIP